MKGKLCGTPCAVKIIGKDASLEGFHHEIGVMGYEQRHIHDEIV